MRLEWITVSKQPTHSSAGQGPLLMRPSSTNVLNTPIPPLNASIPCVAVAGWLGLLIFLPLNPYTNTSTQQTPFFLSLSLPPTWHTGTVKYSLPEDTHRTAPAPELDSSRTYGADSTRLRFATDHDKQWLASRAWLS